MIHQIRLLLGGRLIIPQIFLPPEGPTTAPLTLPNLGKFPGPLTQGSSGGPDTVPPIRHLMSLTQCLKPKVRKPQKEHLARLLHLGMSHRPLIHYSRRRASMSVTRISLRHEKDRQNPILEIRSSLSLKVTAGKPLIPIFLLHGVKIRGLRILIQICLLHGIDLSTEALILTSLHQGGNGGPGLLIRICLHPGEVSLPESGLHTCILELKLGWC